MAVFVVNYAYVDRPEALTAARSRHREFLAGLLALGALIASGPYVGGPAGALLLVRAESAEAALVLLAADPFLTEGLIVERVAREWLPVMGPITPAPEPTPDPTPALTISPAPSSAPSP